MADLIGAVPSSLFGGLNDFTQSQTNNHNNNSDDDTASDDQSRGDDLSTDYDSLVKAWKNEVASPTLMPIDEVSSDSYSSDSYCQTQTRSLYNHCIIEIIIITGILINNDHFIRHPANNANATLRYATLHFTTLHHTTAGRRLDHHPPSEESGDSCDPVGVSR